MAWMLVPALVELRNQLNVIAPNRDKSSDGTIGDKAHASRSSSHNPDKTANAEWEDLDKFDEVRAVDIDVDFKNSRFNAQELVDHLVKYAKNGTFWWLRYIIYNKKIYRKSNGWRRENYGGTNTHTQHVHVNSDFSQKADTVKNVNYRLTELVEVKVATQFNTDDKNELYAAARKTTETTAWPTGGGLKSDVGQGVWNAGFPIEAGEDRTPAWQNIQAIYTKQVDLENQLTALSAQLADVLDVLGQFTTDYEANEPNLLYDTVVDAIEATHTPAS